MDKNRPTIAELEAKIGTPDELDLLPDGSVRPKYITLQGKHDHPEHYCHRCGGRNITWYADNTLWNQVMEGDEGNILCPICFVELAEAKGICPTAWRVAPEDASDEATLLRLRIVALEEEARERS